jgi:hypothetical protein
LIKDRQDVTPAALGQFVAEDLERVRRLVQEVD